MLSRFLVFFIYCIYYANAETTPNGLKCELPFRVCDLNINHGSGAFCYPEQWHCDGNRDCEDGTDEPSTCETVCKDGDFKCASGRCLPRGFLCDKENDCGTFENGAEDLSDESSELCHRPISCRYNEYQCAKSPVCIPLAKFCDGHSDCPDSSDEHSMCNVDDQKMGEKCPYGAAMTLDGLKCYCPQQKYYNKQGECEYINFCKLTMNGHPPVCTQKCEDNLNGTFNCSCFDSRMKLANGTTCVSNLKATHPNIVLLSVAQFFVLSDKSDDSLANSSPQFLSSNAYSLVYQLDSFDKSTLPVLCYTDTNSSNTSLIVCVSPENTVVKKSFPIEINLNVIKIIRYDSIGNNWILTDGNHFITICKHDEIRIHKCSTISLQGVGSIDDLAYDPLAGLAFFAEGDAAKSIGIWRIDMRNGKMKRMTTSEATAVAIDPFTRVLYFADLSVDHIREIDYEMNYVPRIVVGGHLTKHIRKMMFAEGKLLVLMKNNRVLMYDILKSKDQIAVEITPPTSVKSFKSDYPISTWPELLDIIYYRKKELEWKGSNPCKKSECEDICIGSWDKETTCLCEDGAIQTGPKCKRIEKNEVGNTDFLIIAQMRPSAVVTLGLGKDIKTKNVGVPYVQNIKRPSALTVDVNGNRLIAYDLNRHVILIRKIGQENETIHGVQGVMNCEGMAYDHNSDNLYMTDQGRQTVTVSRLSNLSIRKVLIRENMTNPRAITLHLPKSYIFWGSWSERNSDGIPPKIERAKLDGSQRKTIVTRNAMWINGLTVDTENDYLYWCDAFRNVIERIRINGADRQVIVEGVDKIHHPYGLAFFNSNIFWTEFKTGKVKRIDLNNNGSVFEVIHSQNTTIFELSIMSSSKPSFSTTCASSSNKCEQFCFASSCKGTVGCKPISCGCADGMKVTENGKCIEDKSWKDPDGCDEESHFTCRTNKKCIAKSSICDGDDDCGDNSDEDPNTTCKGFECAGQKHQCDGTTCLPLKWVCDGSRDCVDGSDEAEDRCSEMNKQIIENKDKLEPVNTTKPKFCQRTEFRCGNGKCIEDYLVCDEAKNCLDGLDEAHCNDDCIIGRQFRCKKGSACIDISFRCDGVADCDDGSDESAENCKETEDTCSKSNQFKCADGKCIRASHLCDGFADCLSGEDEIECPAEMCNPATNFVCRDGKKCISKHLECDGVDDCGNNSDEDHCTVREEAAELRCQTPMYRCMSSTQFVCISDKQLCDGVNDCPDDDDEGAWCNTTCSSEKICSHQCRATPLGPICTCPTNHYLDKDGVTCQKKDPCRFGECSQLCTPHGSSKFCYCVDGFKLQADRLSCKSDDHQKPIIAYTNRHEIRSIQSDIPGSSAMISKLTNSIALDFKYQSNGSVSIYWTDLTTDYIYCGLMEKRAILYQSIVVPYGVYNAEGIAVDWVTGNIYWIDSSLDTIQVVSSDGTRRATLLSEDMSNARSLAIDPDEGYMFWTDWQESRPRIERASLAGTNRKVIWNVLDVDGAGWPNGITCDSIANRIYWVDARSDSIHTITYEGLEHHEIIHDTSRLGHPFGIDVYEEYVYFSDWKTNTINRINKWHGGNVTLVERVATQPFSLKVVHRSQQNRFLKNPCENESMKNCNGICLINGNNSAKCQCTNFQEETANGCTDMNQILLVNTKTSIRGFSPNPPHSTMFPIVSGKIFDSIRGVVSIGTELRILNIGNSHITFVNLTGSGTERQIGVGTDFIGLSGMTIDEMTGTSYVTITNDRLGMIEAISRDGRSRRVLVDSTDMPGMMKQPRDIVFVDKTRNLYWFDDATNPPGMYSIHGDGFGPMKIDINSTLFQRSYNPVVDQEKLRLYWISAGKLVGFDIKKKKVEEIPVSGNSNQMNISAVTVDRTNGDVLIGEFVKKTNKTTIRRMRFNTDSMEGGVSQTGSTMNLTASTGDKFFLSMILTGVKTPTNNLCSSCDSVCLRGINGNSIVCQCSQGYTMENGVCRTADKRIFYVTDDGTLHSVGWYNSGGPSRRNQHLRQHILHADVAKQRILRMVVDAKRDLVYAVTRQNEVWKCANNGSFATRIFLATSHRIAAIALDRVTGYLLVSARVTMSTRGVIIIIDPARYQEDVQAVLLADEEKVPYEMAVDPPKGKIFWASANCIKSANYDGNNVQCIVGKAVSALAVDEDKSRLCYVDNDRSAIDCVDYDGTNEQRNVAMFKPQGVGELVNFAFNGDELYFFDKFNMSGSIIRCLRQNDGTFLPTDAVLKPFPRSKLRLFDLDIADTKNSVLFTACSNQNGGCEHLCVTTPSVDDDTLIQKRCVCVHSEMGKDGHCVPSPTFIAVSRFSSIEFLPSSPHSLSPPNRKITTDECFMLKAGSLAADLQRKRIYFADYEKYRISAVNFDGTGCFVVAEDVGYAASIAYDEVHQDIYYARANPPGIWRINVANNDLEKYPTEPSIVLTLTYRDRPRKIAIHPCRMLLFFANNAITGSVIERVYFSGYKREMVIQEDLSDVRGLAIDLDAEKLYFTDAKDFRMSRSDYDGSHREVVFTNSDMKYPHPFDLTVYEDEIISTDWVDRSISVFNKLSGNVLRQISISTDIPVDVIVVDPDLEYCGTDACANNDLKCEDYCRMLADGTPSCACNGERKLNSDNRTCTGDIGGKKCAENEFNCMTTDVCIPYEETCDGYNDCLIHDDEDIKFCSTRKCRPGFFSCGNGMCIAESKKCNRVNDCVNFADESNCTCSENEFKCDSGLCIPIIDRCDFKQDCNDASDEKGCPFRNCSGLEKHGLMNLINCKTTTQCILPVWKCDGTNDCFDGWDETDCLVEFDSTGKNVSPPKECDNTTLFPCLATRTCMPKPWRCDGQIDCGDGSDERGCAKKCDSFFEFTCKNSGKCIPIENKCDESIDCPDGEDEENCDHNECIDSGNTTFQCTNHRCIPIEWRCDGTDDCMDNAKSVGSDEMDCGGKTSYRLPSRCANETCEVACELTALLCDGVVDCADGFDEHDCASIDRQCEEGQWMCNSGQCIESNKLCDMSVDCIDGSDEWIDICSLSEPPKRGCPNGWSCILKNGTYGCLEEKQLCDGVVNCMSGVDEQCSLQQGNCSQSRNSCDQRWNCQRRAGFETCSCDSGYHLSAYDQTTCLRSPPCPLANCSHFCIDRRDIGHQCFCAPGYILGENGKDCRRNDTIEAEILLTFGHRLKLFTLDGHSKATLLSNLTNGVSVDYDIKSDLIYWTDIAHNENKAGIVSMSNQPNTYQVMKGLPTKGIDGIAVDWLGRNIYYTDRHQDAISVCDMRGRFQRVLLKGTPLNDPRAIVLDPLEGLLFWTDWGTSAHIGRMNMNGTDAHVLLQDRTIRWPNALAIDAPAQRLYFGDAHRDYIGSCNYDGTKRKIVLRNVVRHIFALSVFEDYIYWSDWHNHTVERAHKITGGNRRVLIYDKFYRPMGFKIVHPALQSFGVMKTSKHPCSQPARCDNLCIPANTEEQYTCMCAQGFRAEGRSCVSECKPLDMVCSGTYKCIASWWKCDGQDDCGDGEDEGFFQPGACPPFPCEAGQYLCSSSKNNNSTVNSICLYPSALCDGSKDCPLGDDEESEFCKQFECGEGHFKCADQKKCIPLSSVCDHSKDCDDGSDEKDCEIKDCGIGFFACLNATSNTIAKCIPNEFYCDGEIDCSQGQDEPNTCVIGQCTSQQFRCKSGRCIAKSRQCDGQFDCRDESDEKDCEQEQKCLWQCEGQCMAVSDVCDGRKDCVNGGDESEEACVRKYLMSRDKCPNRCADGSGCNSKKCDGIIDCDDGSDEKGCNNECHMETNTSMICDGNIQCSNGLDETNCALTYEQLSLFQCSRQAVREWQVCDGVRDCADGKDEEVAMCNQRKAKCGRIGTCDDLKGCFDVLTGMCDGIKDCSDGSDENPKHCDFLCKGKFRCTNGRCVSKTVRCDGSNDCGDWSDEETCGSQCHHFGVCSQECRQSNNQITCNCVEGYTRSRSNPDRCFPMSNFTEIFISNGKTLHWMTLPDGIYSKELNRVKVISMDVIPGAIDVTYEREKTKLMYSVGVYDDRTSMESIVLMDTLNKKQKRDIEEKHFTDSNALIAYDRLHDNIYFTESNDPVPESLFQAQGNIYISSADRKQRVLVVNSTGTISSIAVAPEEKFLFWSTVQPVAKIFFAFLDGSPIEVAATNSQPHKTFVGTSVFDPKALVSDTPNKRLYWIDMFKRTVETIDFWQKDRRVVRKFSLGDGPIAMDMLADELFVLTKTGSIHRMHKFSGHLTEFRQKVGTTSPMTSLKIANPSKIERAAKLANSTSNPCLGDYCPHDSICVPQKNSSKPKCLCEGEYDVFNPSRKSCEAKWSSSLMASQCGDYFCYNDARCGIALQQCICKPGFYGKQCEVSQCAERCLNGASCLVKSSGAMHRIECRCAANYTNYDCATHVCDGVCGPRGTCKMVDCPKGSKICQAQAYCECEPGWEGPQCRHKIYEDPCVGHCFKNGKCTGITQLTLRCDCPQGSTGDRCENCDDLECKNGGVCTHKLTRSKSASPHHECWCPPGFSGKNCEVDLCEGACPFGHKCTYNWTLPSKIQCECQPNAASRSTDCAPICKTENEWCRNGGECIDYPGLPGTCKCLPRFGGPRCEQPLSCSEYCLNNAACLTLNQTHYKCVCRKGFVGDRCDKYVGCDDQCENGGTCFGLQSNRTGCICPKGLGGDRCETITATSCGSLDCANGGICSTVFADKNKPACICPPGWGGLVCRTYTCDSYCHHGGKCELQKNQDPICRCSDDFYGTRCQYRVNGSFPRRSSSSTQFWPSLFWIIVFAAIITLVIGGFAAYKSNRFSVFRQFRHAQMEEVGAPVDQFSNPAYMVDESGSVEMTTVNTSLVSDQERNAFSNPVFEQEMVPIYNDTVENAELLSNNR